MLVLTKPFNFFFRLKSFVFFFKALSYIVNLCKRRVSSAGILKYNDDWTANEVANRLSANIASNLNINFNGSFKYHPSTWTKNEIDQFNNFKNGVSYCLRNFPHKLFQSPTCGNGFVETGEDCDCGLSGVCNNLFCDPKTCKRITPCSNHQANSTKETVTVNSTSRYWQCDNGQNIDESVLCNGLKDCNDGSDETINHCFGRTCPANLFRCR